MRQARPGSRLCWDLKPLPSLVRARAGVGSLPSLALIQFPRLGLAPGAWAGRRAAPAEELAGLVGNIEARGPRQLDGGTHWLDGLRAQTQAAPWETVRARAHTHARMQKCASVCVHV